jgi:hypothetical protein
MLLLLLLFLLLLLLLLLPGGVIIGLCIASRVRRENQVDQSPSHPGEAVGVIQSNKRGCVIVNPLVIVCQVQNVKTLSLCRESEWAN